jgi:glyceraldehyde-3-phosphate dehydrogenase/erythrose-4-phosphate dehydrogenase
MYSVGLEAVLMTAIHADTMPKKMATAMHEMVAMNNSFSMNVLSWNKMSKMSMVK